MADTKSILDFAERSLFLTFSKAETNTIFSMRMLKNAYKYCSICSKLIIKELEKRQ